MNTMINLDDVVNGYTAALLWSQHTDDETFLDASFGPENFTEEALAIITARCSQFVERAHALLTEDNFTGRADGSLMSRVGHDLAGCQTGNGFGFWDGDWGSVGDELTELARIDGEALEVVIGDDDQLHLTEWKAR